MSRGILCLLTLCAASVPVQGQTASSGDVDVYLRSNWALASTDATPDSFWMRPDDVPLFLFSDGTAMDQLPEAPLASFDPATIQATFDPDVRSWYVGSWERADARVTIVMDEESRDLCEVSSGWRSCDNENAAVYRPARALQAHHLIGRWATDEVFVPAAMLGLPSGDSGLSEVVFSEDGTVTGGVFGSRTGRWTLDGLFLTLEVGAQQSVLPAFTLSEAENVSQIRMGNALWERPPAN